MIELLHEYQSTMFQLFHSNTLEEDATWDPRKGEAVFISILRSDDCERRWVCIVGLVGM